MNIINVKVNFTKGTCETTGINLITGDYNSTKMVFQFDRDDGTKIFEMKSPSEELVMVQEIQNNEIVLYGLDEDEEIASIFTEDGNYIFEISLYENGSKLTSASGKLKVKPEQVVIGDEVVEVYLPIFDQLMQQITTAITETNNLDLDMNNDDGVVTATLTKKDGTTKEVEIIDTGDYYTKDEVDSIKTTIEGEIPTKVSQLTNDSAFINKEVNNLTYYTLATGTGSTIELSIDSSTYVMTLNLKNSAGTTISTGSIDLPLETMVVDGSYDSTNKKIVLELDNGNTIDIPVGDLISGLQTEITNSNKLSSDLVDDTGHTNKFVTSSNKTTWNAKYDKPSGGIPKTDLASAVQTSLGKADTALQSHQDITGKEDKSNKATAISGSSTDTQYPSAKCVYDSQVAQDTLIEDLQTEKDYMESIINQLPKVSGTGTSITLEDTLEAKMTMDLAPTEMTQEDTPTPSTPQDIHTNSGDNNVVVGNRNLLKITTFTNNTKTATSNGVTATINSDGSISMSGTATANAALYLTKNNFTLSGAFYYLCNSPSANARVEFQCNVNGTTKYLNDYGTGNKQNASESFEFTNVYIIVNNGTNVDGLTFKPMIALGAEVEEWEPHQVQTAPLNLPVENFFDKDTASLVQKGITSATGVISGTNTTRLENDNLILLKAGTYTISNAICNSVWVWTYNLSNQYQYQELMTTWYDNNSYTFTLIADRYVRFIWRKTDNSTIDIDSDFKIQLEKGTKANSYTPYGTTPLEYCKIGNYEDEFMKPSGSNLFDITAFENQLVAGKIIYDDGTEMNDNSSTYSKYKIHLKAGETIHIKGYFQRIYYYNENGTFISRSASSGSTEMDTTYTPTNNEYIEFQIKNDTWASNKGHEMVNLGSTALPYEPYNNGKWYLKKKVLKKVFDGSDTGLSIYSESASRTVFQTSEINNIESYTASSTAPTLLSNYFISVPVNATWVVGDISRRTNNNKLYLTYEPNTTIEQFNTWLSTHNTEVYYVLATPEYILLNNTLQEQLDNIHEKILSYKGQTNISQVNNDLGFNISAATIYDLNKLIDRVAILES